MADVDQFKQFNDRHGHAAGDTVLAGLAGLLNTNIRDTDVACRYGGEEFALVLAELNLENGVKRVEKLRQAVKTLTVTRGGRQLGPVTLSFGVAAYPEHGTKPEELLGAADTALYTAKRLGRDRVVVAP
jgi:diguanylate cyclase (GGDEF)-like protein